MKKEMNEEIGNLQKIIVDGRYIDSIGENDLDMSEPAFRTIEELKYGLR